MDFQTSSNAVTGFLGMGLVFIVCATLVWALATAVRSHLAKSRATKLVTQARNLIAVGVFGRDEHDNPGPAERLGEAYRLQRAFHLRADMIGLRDDAELDELINRAIRGIAPSQTVDPSEMDTLPNIKVQQPDFAAQIEVPTQQDLTLGDRIAAAHKAENPGSDDNGDEYLQNCADMTAGLSKPFNRNDIN